MRSMDVGWLYISLQIVSLVLLVMHSGLKKKWAWCQVAYVQIPAPSFTTCGTIAKLFKIATLPHVLIGVLHT